MHKIFFLVPLFVLLSVPVLGNNSNVIVFKEDTLASKQAKHYMVLAKNSKDSIDLALKFADSAINSYEHLLDSEALKAKALLFKGKLLLKQGEMQLAIRALNEGLTLGKKANDTAVSLLIHKKLGDIYLSLENYKVGIEHFEAVMAYKDSLRNPALYAAVHADLGLIYTNFKDYAVALQHYEQALQFFMAEQNLIWSSRLLKRIAEIHLIKNELKKALHYYNQSLGTQKSFATDQELSATLSKIGKIYLMLDKNHLAVSYLTRSLERKGAQMDTTLLQTYLKLGKAHFKNESFGLAEESFYKSLKLAKKTKDKQAEAEIFKYLADIYENKGYQSKGIRYFKNYVALKDSLLGIENKKAIAEIKAEFETENKEKAIEILEQQKELLSSQARAKEQKIESNRNLLILFTVLIVLSIVLIMLLFLRHNAKKNINQMLQRHLVKVNDQKEEIEAQRDTIKKSNAKLEDAQNTIIKQNKKLKHTNELLEQTVSNRTLELYKAYQKLSFHVNNTSLAVMELNPGLEVIRWSEQAERIFGWKAGEVLGLPYDLVGFILEKDMKAFKSLINKLVQGEKTSVYSTGRNFNKYGDLLSVEWNISVLHNEDGSVDSLLAIANDVTSREKAFKDLKDSNEDLDNFIYKASHDLRGPLARIQGVVNIALMEINEQASIKYFKLLESTSNELDTILSRLLMIYDINHHERKVEQVKVYDNIKDILDKVIKSKKIKDYFYRINVSKDLVICTDKTLFQITIENMFDNALYYKDKREEKPMITFSAESFFNNRVIFHVSDNGLGIPEDRKNQVFDMFFHGAAKSGGTGLGLYMSRQVVERMNGNIKLLKTEKNTIFKIVLPTLQSPTLLKPTPSNEVPLEEVIYNL